MKHIYRDKKENINVLHMIFVVWFLLDYLSKTNICDAIKLDRFLLNDIQNVITLSLVVTYCVFGIMYSFQDILIIIVIGGLCSISALLSHSYVLLSAFLFMVLIKNSDIEEIIKIVYKILIILTPIVVILSLFGVIDGGNTRRLMRIRYGLGFTHPNTFGWVVLESMCCGFYLRRKKLSKLDFFVTLIMIPFLYYIPNSLSAVVGAVMLFGLMAIYDWSSKHNGIGIRIVNRVLLFLGMGVNLYSIYFTINSVSKYKITYLIDRFASSRLFYTNKSFSMFGLSFIGQEIYLRFAWQKGYSETYMDNSFATLLLRYGIVWYLIYTVASWFAFKRLMKNDFALLICFFVFYFMGVMNSSVLSVGTNVFMLCFAPVMFLSKIRFVWNRVR